MSTRQPTTATNPKAFAEPWTPSSWRTKPIKQDVVYPEEALPKLDKVLKKLRTLPPLVTPVEIEKLKSQLADVSNGRGFLLQSGDCAELFSYCSSEPIEAKLKLMLLMSLVIIWGSRVKVVRMIRGAGQYAKPRSKPTEMVNGKEVLSFRGDNVNGFDPDERVPDPDRLLGAYFHSAATMNHLRSLLHPSSGFADLHKPSSWSFSHVRDPELQKSFEDIVNNLTDALEFMNVVGADPSSSSEGSNGGGGAGGLSGAASSLSSVDVWVSHEGLLLEYEEALTRVYKALPTAGPMSAFSGPASESRSRPKIADHPLRSRQPSVDHSLSSSVVLEKPTSIAESNGVKDTPEDVQKVYNTSAHFLWIGDRTRQLDGAHVEYFRGIQNPIGIKVGPTMTADELVRMLDIVDPNREPGRVTLICRYGSSKVEDCLPEHIRAVRNTDHRIIWACDPMHGNTKPSTLDASIKTRHMADIVLELSRSLRIHASLGSRLGGVHLELTGETDDNGFSVTECVGGSMDLEDSDLSLNYATYCDPRLNYEQSLDVAFLISDYFQGLRRGRNTEDKILANLSLKSRPFA